MGGSEAEIMVHIVDENDNRIAPRPAIFTPEPPKTGEAIIKQLMAAGYGPGLLVGPHPRRATVMNGDPVPAGQYTYRVTGAGAGPSGTGAELTGPDGSAAGPSGSRAGASAAGFGMSPQEFAQEVARSLVATIQQEQRPRARSSQPRAAAAARAATTPSAGATTSGSPTAAMGSAQHTSPTRPAASGSPAAATGSAQPTSPAGSAGAASSPAVINSPDFSGLGSHQSLNILLGHDGVVTENSSEYVDPLSTTNAATQGEGASASMQQLLEDFKPVSL